MKIEAQTRPENRAAPLARESSLASMPWRLLALDLDGTLIGRDHKILDADLAAVARARAAGLYVSICTGRNSRECAGIAMALDVKGPGIFVNGAAICDMSTGKTVRSRVIPKALAERLVDALGGMGHAVLILVNDAKTERVEYFLTDHATPHRATTEWLIGHEVKARVCNALDDPLMDAIVRLTVVVGVGESDAIVSAMAQRFGNEIHMENLRSPLYECQVLEIFTAGTNKWTGIVDLCGILGLDVQTAVAIGDDVNDLAMLRNARLSFAMGSAREEVRRAAKRVTVAQAQCGVAAAIDEMLAMG